MSKSRTNKRNNQAQLGIFEFQQDSDEDDLEAELQAITTGSSPQKKEVAKPKLINDSDLNRMVTESLKDNYSDDSEGDDDDIDLLNELQKITGDSNTQSDELESAIEHIESPNPNGDDSKEKIDILEKRLKTYKIAERNAKTSGEMSRARRFDRGAKTIQDLLNKAKAGKSINLADIPPEIITKNTQHSEDDSYVPTVPNRTAPPAPKILNFEEPKENNEAIFSPTSDNSIPLQPPTTIPTLENSTVKILRGRFLEYKKAALEAKKKGDKESALQFLKIVKQFDVVIKMAENDEPVDLSDMPPPPDQLKDFLEKMNLSIAPENEESQIENEKPENAIETKATALGGESETLLEALNERLLVYRKVEDQAKTEGNSGKVRRFGRIVKQYEDVIRLHKAGKEINTEELPTPPGFGPLPKSESTTHSSSTISSNVTVNTNSHVPEEEVIKLNKPTKQSNKIELTSRVSGSTTNLAEKQMQTLIDRQREFKLAAIEAKKSGELEQAKEYLLIFKKFEKLLDAAAIGLPVDLNSLPIPPSQRSNLEESFAIVNKVDCDPDDNSADIVVRLEEQLAKQLMMCKNTRDHHKAMGDVAGMNRFENLALSVQKDLDFLRALKRKNLEIPKFHYEQKSFNIIHCNTDLSDNEVEICVIRGLNYNVANPKDADTYVKIEFPYPQEDPFKSKTTVIKDTDNPDYDQKFKVEIQRSNRQCQRVFKRHAIKFEVYSRGCGLARLCWKFPICCFSGFLRSDVLIGTVNVKLQQLEAKCEIHDSFDIMDGRKVTGGKLEVKVRCRNPILTKQIEHINEKWLILDS